MYYLTNYLNLTFYFIITFGISIILWFISFLLTFSFKKNREQTSAYECGFECFDNITRQPFDIQFYLLGILFVIFDIEIVMLFPALINFKWLCCLSICSILFFISLLALGLFYEWKLGILNWMPNKTIKNTKTIVSACWLLNPENPKIWDSTCRVVEFFIELNEHFFGNNYIEWKLSVINFLIIILLALLLTAEQKIAIFQDLLFLKEKSSQIFIEFVRFLRKKILFIKKDIINLYFNIRYKIWFKWNSSLRRSRRLRKIVLHYYIYYYDYRRITSRDRAYIRIFKKKIKNWVKNYFMLFKRKIFKILILIKKWGQNDWKKSLVLPFLQINNYSSDVTCENYFFLGNWLGNFGEAFNLLLFIYFFVLILILFTIEKCNKEKLHSSHIISIITLFFFYFFINTAFNFNSFGLFINNYFDQNLFLIINLILFVIFLSIIVNTFVFKTSFRIHYELTIVQLFFFGVFILMTKNLMMVIVAFIGINLHIYCLLALHHFFNFQKEATVKYLYISSLSTISLIYSFSCILIFFTTIDFWALIITLFSSRTFPELNNYFTFFLFFFVICFFFKIGAFPTQLWLIEVYNVLNYNLLYIFMTALKFIFCYILYSWIVNFNLSFFTKIFKFLIICTCLSMFNGVWGSLYEKQIKKFLSYSSLNQIGFFLMGFCLTFNFDDFFITFNFLVIYILTNVCIFICLIQLTNINCVNWVIYFQNLRCFINNLENTKVYKLWIVSFFSMASIPPMLGFFTKITLLYFTIQYNLWLLLSHALILSVWSAYYYLSVIKYNLTNKYVININKTTHNNNDYYLYLFILIFGSLFYKIWNTLYINI